MASTDIRRAAVTLLALGAPLALAAGCGGGADKPTTLTKAEVISRGSVICKAAERRVEQLPEVKSEHPFAKGTSRTERDQARRFLAGYADALDSSRLGLQRLAAPPQDRALLKAYLADIATVARELRTASKAAPDAVEREAGDAFQRFDRASRRTAAYGFPKGVCGSGASG